MYKVAVYGTLRRGQRNHWLLDQADFLFNDIICGVIYDLGGCPAFKFYECDDFVKVEVYQVTKDILDRLDRLEGHPDFYKRIKVFLFENNEDVWAYEFQDDVDRYPEIEGGDWVKHYEAVQETYERAEASS